MIEKKIHRLWCGPKPMPKKYRDYGQQWADMNPDWDVCEWRPETLPPLENQGIWDMIGDWPKSSIPMDDDRAIAVQRADVAGYEIIWQFGGIYMNCDIQPLRPMNELIEETGDRAFAGYEGEYDGKWFLVNAVLGGPAKHPFWKDCIDNLAPRYLNLPMSPMEQTTGPHLLTTVYEERWVGRTDEFIALPQHYFNPVHFHTIEAGHDASDRVQWAIDQGAYALHHWGHREDQANYS